MQAIIADEYVFCSPSCARRGLGDEPDDVWFHDPQFTVDRESIGIDPATVGLQPEADGFAAIDSIDELVTTTWRL